MASFRITPNERVHHSTLICRICGDVARGLNYGVISCMPCKVYFRRHALDKSKTLNCSFNGHCDISRRTRIICSACRLQKCFALGMNPRLIRINPQKQLVPKRIGRIQQQIPLPPPTPLNLLRNDQSILTSDDWNLLSNIIHAYDAENITGQTKLVLKEQHSLPWKLRFKVPSTLALNGLFYTAVRPFIERCPYFHALPGDARQLLVQHNVSGIGSLNTVFVSRETNLYAEPLYMATCASIYGTDFITGIGQYIDSLEQNGTLMKVILIIVAFSSNCSIVTFDPSRNYMTSVTGRTDLVHVQNILVTLMWKYLLYQYGFIGAVRHFDLLIRNCLSLFQRMEQNNSTKHWDMVDEIVDQTANLLIIDS